MSAAERQRASLQEQLEGTRELADKGFVSKNQVRQIERSIAQFEGASAEYRSRDAAAREQIGPRGGRLEVLARIASGDGAGDARQGREIARHAHPGDDPVVVVDERDAPHVAPIGDRFDEILEGLVALCAALLSSIHHARDRTPARGDGPNFSRRRRTTGET